MDTISIEKETRDIIQAEKLEPRILEMQREYPVLSKMEDGIEIEMTERERVETLANWAVAEHATAKYEQERNRQKNELSDLYSGLENDTLDLPGIRKILLYLCVGAGIQPRGKDENVDIDLAKQ